MPLEPGTRLGSYEVQALLGVGGMGEVYRAEDVRLNRIVALKVVTAELATQSHFRERFEAEAATTSRLNHPNICTLHDLGHQDGVDFFVMEFVNGDTLADRLEGGRLSLGESLDIAVQMARGLAHAHRHGVVHRDIKPANVMFADDGLVKIVDFGVARSASRGSITETGTTVGTLAYMAPEQLLKERDVTAASDVWSLGIVLYEMTMGQRPFGASDVGPLLRSILHDPVPPLKIPGTAGARLGRILKRVLDKDPQERPAAAELAEELAALRSEISSTAPQAPVPPAPSRAWLLPGAAVAAVLAIVVAGWWLVGSSRSTRIAGEALPEIDRLIGQDDYIAAFALARRTQAELGEGDPALARVWPLVSVAASIMTEPPGATVAMKPYADSTGEWQPLGTTPLKVTLPRGSVKLRIEKAGFETVFLARALTASFEPPPITLRETTADTHMVEVPGDTLPVNLSGFNTEALVALPTFLIDRTEVTNRAFKEFVAAGGYERDEFWSATGTRDVAPFLDATGRVGPATWEAGTFPEGRGDEPVGGVSWFEAAAYCAFRGEQLPTLYHWARAALPPREVTAPMGPSIVPLSNFAGQGPAPVGKFTGMGPYGTDDMAGNLREWTWNASSQYRRFILGGSWNDPDYMFSVPLSLLAGDRSPANGFRCMRSPGTGESPEQMRVAAHLLEPVDVSASDYRTAKPVSNEVFDVFARQLAYVPSNVTAPVEVRETTSTGSIREQTTIDVGYGGERMRVYVFLPPDSAPPYQAVVYFPALNAFQLKVSSTTFLPADYVVKSGRALVLPVFKGSFERWDPALGLSGQDYLRALRQRIVEWRQDLGRTLDYLQARGDIDMTRVGYYGRSFGASMPLPLLALESRLKLAILHSGGFTYRGLPAEADAVNYASRIRIPVLMLNGRHDYVHPSETSQKPLFQMLGTPAADKRHILYEAGHDPLPRSQFVREILAWLDRYLGQPAD